MDIGNKFMGILSETFRRELEGLPPTMVDALVAAVEIKSSAPAEFLTALTPPVPETEPKTSSKGD